MVYRDFELHSANTQAPLPIDGTRPVANLTFRAGIHAQVVKYCNAIIIIDLIAKTLRDTNSSLSTEYKY